jgi:hypothetical protein
MKDILSKLDSIETPTAGVPAPTLPTPVKLDEHAQMRVLAGQSSMLTEAAAVVIKPKAKKAEKVEDPQVECLDDDMEEDLAESAAQIAAREKFKAMVSKVEPVVPVSKDKSKGKPGEFASELKKHMKTEESGLAKKDKSVVGKKAVAGKDNSAKGKGFANVEKAATMLKGQTKKKAVKESIDRKLSFKQLVSLVQESGGQQQIDPTDTKLFTWAQRVASAKFEGVKQELYAGMVYERMGGAFRMFDVLSEAMDGNPDSWSEPERDDTNPAVTGELERRFDQDFYDIAWHYFDESEEFVDAVQAIGKAYMADRRDNNALAALKNTIESLYEKAFATYTDEQGNPFDEGFDESMGQTKQNWFETLRAALASEGLDDEWPTNRSISYGETARVKTDDELISITRNTDGRYERPVHYKLR